MCGIAGIFQKKITGIDHNQAIKRMSDAMKHRGPNDEGFFYSKGTHLAHRRLSIIDIASGHQPMTTNDERYTIVFNGEIYNFNSIKQELINFNHQFTTVSDTEVLLKAYQQWGVKCLQKLIGMFSFAIHDNQNESVFICRDRLGIKPLYYYETDHEIIFASEIKALIQSRLMDRSININSLDYFMTLSYLPQEHSLFEGVKKLKPGHYALINNSGLVPHRYWWLNETPSYDGTFNEASNELERLLKDSVQLRLISDVPIGVFLSGGIDSAAIVAMVSGQRNKPIDTFSMGYENSPDISELANAKKTASRYNTNHHELLMTHSDFISALKSAITFSEDPIVDDSAIALHQLSKFSSQHATVLLGGEGSDEIFAGYPLYRLMAKTEKIRKYLSSIIQHADSPLLSNNEKLNKYIHWCSKPLLQKYKSIPNDLTPTIKHRMYNSDFYDAQNNNTNVLFESITDEMFSGTDLQKMQQIDLQTWLPDNLLLKGDKMSMAASIELRVPFLDHRLVEFGFSLPDKYKIHNGTGKYILKHCMEKYIDHSIIYQKKKGFPVPITEWFRNKLFDEIHDTILSTNSLCMQYFNRQYINRILQDHRTGKQDLSRRILTFLTLELWHQHFINPKTFNATNN